MAKFKKNVLEIEFKYRAAGVSLKDFHSICKSLGGHKLIKVASWDYYFKPKSKKAQSFLRYRQGDTPEFTVKIKTNKNNNQTRIEYDLPINPYVDEAEVLPVVSGIAESLGFGFNFKIYKNCTIYIYKNLSIVYYTVYNDKMKVLDHFIEIEASKKGNFKSTKEAMQVVVNAESKLKVLGINQSKRLKNSLYELYKK